MKWNENQGAAYLQIPSLATSSWNIPYGEEKTELFKTQIKTSSKATIGLKPRGWIQKIRTKDTWYDWQINRFQRHLDKLSRN